MPQPWPWVKVMERSSSSFPQTHIFFVPNIKGLAQTILIWEGKVFAAADADADVDAADADAAETDWKHKVTPERGDLINMENHKTHIKWKLIWQIFLTKTCIYYTWECNLFIWITVAHWNIPSEWECWIYSTKDIPLKQRICRIQMIITVPNLQL